jgi:nucleolar protein 56
MMDLAKTTTTALGEREALLAKAKAGVKKAFASKDMMLIQAIRGLDDLDSAKNLLCTRLREWFSFNFPELRLENDESMCAIIAEFGAKEEIEQSKLAAIIGADKARYISEKARASFGAPLDESDREALKALAKQAKALFEERRKLEAYIQKEASEYLKNLSHLTDAILATRLVAMAGGLERLARLPASVIQVMGAEKALFKHLRKGTKPPKHGVIFQSAYVRGAPAHTRGKIARALAAKLAIAAKADFYTKKFIAPKLKEDFELRLQRIREQSAAESAAEKTKSKTAGA